MTEPLIESPELLPHGAHGRRDAPNDRRRGNPGNSSTANALTFSDPRQALALAREEYALTLGKARDTEFAAILMTLALNESMLAHYDDALEHMREAMAVAVEVGAEGLQAYILNALGCVYLEMGDCGPAFDYCARSRDLAQRIGAKRVYAHATSNLGLIESNRGAHVQSMKYFDESLVIHRDDNNRSGEAHVLQGIAGIYLDLGQYATGLEFMELSLRVLRELGETSSIAIALNNMGEVFMKIDDHATALERFQESLEISTELGDRLVMAAALANIGTVYRNLGKHAQALLYLGDGIMLCREIGDKRTLASALGELADLYRITGKPTEAELHAREAIALAQGTDNICDLARLLVTAGRIELALDRSDAAFDHWTEALRLAELTGTKRVAAEARRHIAEAHAAAGDHERAYREYVEFHTLTSSVDREDYRKAIGALGAVHDFEREKQRAEVFRIQTEQLRRELDLQKENLTSMAMSLIQHNTFLDSIKGDLTEISGAHGGRDDIGRIIRRIKQHARGDEQWSQFNIHFHRLHGDFIRNLADRHPSLSNAELKVCALLKLGLPSKEIAGILNVSIRCIETHRYAIRKKMSISGSESLSSVLMNCSEYCS